MTGGTFGVEVSVVMVAVCSLIPFGLLVVALRRLPLLPSRSWER